MNFSTYDFFVTDTRPAGSPRSRASPTCATNPENTFFKIAADDSTPLGRAFRSAPKTGYFQNCREMRPNGMSTTAA